MNPKPKKLELYDDFALLLATTHDERAALICWRAMRSMVREEVHLFAIKPKYTDRLDRFIVNEQIDELLDQGQTYTTVAQHFRVDWRAVRERRDRWWALSEEEKAARRERWAERRRDPASLVELARDQVNRVRLRQEFAAREDDEAWDDDL
jgi:hypothetical protein